METTPQGDAEIAATIIAMEKAALNRWGRGDPDGYLEISAPEVTYFSPYTDQRVDGLDALTERYEPVRNALLIERFEMNNPRVQVHGDTALLTFNLTDYEKDPESGNVNTTHWNSTEVYVRIDGEWKIIHTHWALTGHGGVAGTA
jgi:uncharacterized protein (TIGR02246 family)